MANLFMKFSKEISLIFKRKTEMVQYKAAFCDYWCGKRKITG